MCSSAINLNKRQIPRRKGLFSCLENREFFRDGKWDEDEGRKKASSSSLAPQTTKFFGSHVFHSFFILDFLFLTQEEKAGKSKLILVLHKIHTSCSVCSSRETKVEWDSPTKEASDTNALLHTRWLWWSRRRDLRWRRTSWEAEVRFTLLFTCFAFQSRKSLGDGAHFVWEKQQTRENRYDRTSKDMMWLLNNRTRKECSLKREPKALGCSWRSSSFFGGRSPSSYSGFWIEKRNKELLLLEHLLTSCLLLLQWWSCVYFFFLKDLFLLLLSRLLCVSWIIKRKIYFNNNLLASSRWWS